MVIGGKGIGKTYGLRKQLLKWFIEGKRGRFVEFSRSKIERNSVSSGYFDRLVQLGEFKDYEFRTDSEHGYVAHRIPDGQKHDKQDWEICCYFAALSNFQIEKRRTFANVGDFIFDEFIIDAKDRFHYYLPDEFSVLANLMDSISREQPGSDEAHRLYMMANACDMSCPHMRALGVDRLPEFGYSYHRGKMVLLHYVEPWDARERQAATLVGRMLEGSEESKMVFENVFATGDTRDVQRKPGNARFAYGLVFKRMQYSIWIDYSQGLAYVCEGIPKGSRNVYALTRRDSTIDYQALSRSHELLQLVSRFFYGGTLRYDSIATRESFHDVLAFLGIR